MITNYEIIDVDIYFIEFIEPQTILCLASTTKKYQTFLIQNSNIYRQLIDFIKNKKKLEISNIILHKTYEFVCYRFPCMIRNNIDYNIDTDDHGYNSECDCKKTIYYFFDRIVDNKLNTSCHDEKPKINKFYESCCDEYYDLMKYWYKFIDDPEKDIWIFINSCEQNQIKIVKFIWEKKKEILPSLLFLYSYDYYGDCTINHLDSASDLKFFQERIKKISKKNRHTNYSNIIHFMEKNL
jgi:hypothetical protein